MLDSVESVSCGRSELSQFPMRRSLTMRAALNQNHSRKSVMAPFSPFPFNLFNLVQAQNRNNV